MNKEFEKLEGTSAEKIALIRIKNSLKAQGMMIRDNKSYTSEEALQQMDVVWNFNKIADNYKALQPYLEQAFRNLNDEKKKVKYIEELEK